MDKVASTINSLRELAKYLMETALRAKVAGHPTAFAVEGLIGMSAQIIDGVMLLESLVGPRPPASQPGPTPTAPAPTSPPVPSAQPAMASSLSEITRVMTDSLKQQSAEWQRALADVQRQLAELRVNIGPPPVTPPVPQPEPGPT